MGDNAKHMLIAVIGDEVFSFLLLIYRIQSQGFFWQGSENEVRKGTRTF